MKVRRTTKSGLLLRTLLLSAAFLAAGCHSKEPPQPTELRGRVLDDESGQPIPGAIVVAKYQGGVAWGGGSCNRLESAVADQNGEFSLPLDPQSGPLYREAYHRDYVHGHLTRYAVGLAPDQYQVWVQRRNERKPKTEEEQQEEKRKRAAGLTFSLDEPEFTVIAKEPTIYRTRAEAQEASRELKDVYLRRFKGTRAERLMELSRLTGMGRCGGGALIHGPFEFLEAIYEEQKEVDAPKSNLETTLRAIEIAKTDMARARELENAKKK